MEAQSLSLYFTLGLVFRIAALEGAENFKSCWAYQKALYGPGGSYLRDHETFGPLITLLLLSSHEMNCWSLPCAHSWICCYRQKDNRDNNRKTEISKTVSQKNSFLLIRWLCWIFVLVPKNKNKTWITCFLWKLWSVLSLDSGISNFKVSRSSHGTCLVCQRSSVLLFKLLNFMKT